MIDKKGERRRGRQRWRKGGEKKQEDRGKVHRMQSAQEEARGESKRRKDEKE